jgi:WS/DGAT/MGAT family acyltransferase
MAERLSAVDASFLAFRWPGHPLVTFRLLVFDGPAPGLDEFREHVRSRLQFVPRLRQRLAGGRAGLGRPRWIDDPGFELERHVRAGSGTAPGDEAALRSLCAELSTRPIDLGAPLWELCYLERLEHDRFAVAARFHHALADGLSALHIVERLFATADEVAPGRPGDGPDPGARTGDRPGRATSGAGDRLRATVRRARRFRRALGRNLKDVPPAIHLVRERGDAPLTPLSRGPAGPQRGVEWLLVPLADLRLAQTVFGTTINNVVLAAVAGGLRRYLDRRGETARELIAMVPVSSRNRDDLDRLGNRVGSMLTTLPVSEPDPAERLRVVSESAARGAASLSAPGTTLLTTVAKVGPLPAMRHLMRRSFSGGFYNLTVTNMIGPTRPLRCCGRSLRSILPVALTTPYHGMTIGVVSYLDTVALAVTTDRERVPDGDLLAADLRAALDELNELAAARGG